MVRIVLERDDFSAERSDSFSEPDTGISSVSSKLVTIITVHESSRGSRVQNVRETSEVCSSSVKFLQAEERES